MNLTISGHHLEVTPALREYVTAKLERVTRHFDQVVDITVILSVEKLSEKERKYMKKLDGSFDVWIAEDGTPLASRSSQTVSGRAFVVVSFEMKNDEDLVYGVVGDRLVALRKESRTSGSGMGEKGEGKVIKTLQVLS